MLDEIRAECERRIAAREAQIAHCEADIASLRQNIAAVDAAKAGKPVEMQFFGGEGWQPFRKACKGDWNLNDWKFRPAREPRELWGYYQGIIFIQRPDREAAWAYADGRPVVHFVEDLGPKPAAGHEGG